MPVYLSLFFLCRKHPYLSQLPSHTFINSHLKCNTLQSPCGNALSSALRNEVYNYRIQQLKVQFSSPCLVKAFAQVKP